MMAGRTDSDDLLTPALTELHDSFARVRAQVHVLRLAVHEAGDERDILALVSHLSAIDEELHEAEAVLKLQASRSDNSRG